MHILSFKAITPIRPIGPFIPESYVPLNYLEFFNITFLRVLLTDGVRKPHFYMQMILIGSESILETPYVTDMAYCCLFSFVLPYYQWLASYFCVCAWQMVYFKDIANFITNKKISQYR